MTENDKQSLMASWPQRGLAVVIGGGAMGTAVARRLGQHDRLLLADIDADRLEIQAGKLREEGIQVTTAQCDITDADSVAQLVEKTDSLGGFRKVAHVTGLSPGMGDWQTVLSVNLRGPALIAQGLQPLLERGAVAVFISSLSAHLAAPEEGVLALLDDPACPDLPENLNRVMDGKMTPQLAYMLSKVGVIRLARRLAVSWGKRDARAMSLSPGLIATPQGAGEFRNSSSKYQLLSQCPLQRQGNMQEIADTVEFLMSDRATYINGIDLLVDGGLNAALLESR